MSTIDSVPDPSECAGGIAVAFHTWIPDRPDRVALQQNGECRTERCDVEEDDEKSKKLSITTVRRKAKKEQSNGALHQRNRPQVYELSCKGQLYVEDVGGRLEKRCMSSTTIGNEDDDYDEACDCYNLRLG